MMNTALGKGLCPEDFLVWLETFLEMFIEPDGSIKPEAVLMLQAQHKDTSEALERDRAGIPRPISEAEKWGM